MENLNTGSMQPQPAAHPDAQSKAPPRRLFFRFISSVLGAAAAVTLAVPLVGYFFGQRRRRVHWVAIGTVDSFPPGETRMVTFDNPLGLPWDGVTAQAGVYVRNRSQEQTRPDDEFLVLAVNCAHLGCPVSWFPQSGLFMCPCHGGVYYADGQRASGPPPRGMFRCVWRVKDGQLEIQAPHFPSLEDTLEKTSEEIA